MNKLLNKLFQNYVLKTVKSHKSRTDAGSLLRGWGRTGTALIAVLIAAPGLVYAADAEQIVSTTCAACHGADGKSVAPMFPNLAGQNSIYLKKQLNDFIDGRRKNNIMSPIVAALKSEDVDALTAYFSAQNPVQKPAQNPARGSAVTPQMVEAGMIYYTGGSRDAGMPGCVSCHLTVAAHKSEDVAAYIAYFNPKNKNSAKNKNIVIAKVKPVPESEKNTRLIEAGKTFYMNGNTDTGVPSCTGCHREEGIGDKSYPRLSGQSPAYIAQQLANFKTGARANDSYGLMRSVVVRMTEQEIKAVAEYLAVAGQ